MTNIEKCFQIQNIKLTYSEKEIRYNAIRRDFYNLAVEARAIVEKDFPEKFDSLDDFCNKAPDWAASLFFPTAKFAIKKMAELNFFEMDVQTYMAEVMDFTHWNRSFSVIQDKLDEIGLNEKEREARRASRTESATSWVGGGFGVKGAIKGAVQAEAFNLVGGAVSGTFNMLGRGISAVGNSLKKSEIMNSAITKNTIVDGIYNTIFYSQFDFVQYISTNCRYEIQAILAERKEKADRLMVNLIDGIIPEAKIDECIANILQMNPYKHEVYIYMLDRYNGNDEQIWDMADFFMVSQIIEKERWSKLEKYLTSLNIKTEDEGILSREKIEQKAKELKIRNFIKYDLLEDLISKLHIQERTVGDIVHETKDAAIAQREYLMHKNEVLTRKTTYILLAVFLGSFGAHDFYAGAKRNGIIKLAITFASLGYLSVISWGLGIYDIVKANRDKEFFDKNWKTSPNSN